MILKDDIHEIKPDCSSGSFKNVTPGSASASGSILPTTSELSEPSYVEMYEESPTPNVSYQQALLGACGTALLRIVHLQNILRCRYATSSEQDREMDDTRLEALS
ncbi:MAG: hypothetical protein ACREDR_33590, partial [Blastocatellia bacterium]